MSEQHNNKSTAKAPQLPHTLSPQSSVQFKSGNFRLGKVLGKGANGTVYLGRRSDGQSFAVKVVKLSSSTLNEVMICQLLALPQNYSTNIVKLVDHRQLDGHLYCAMELCGGGEAFNYIIEKGTLSDAQAGDYCHQLATGLLAAHNAGVAHRDLKLENVLLSEDLRTVKIADFGLSTTQELAGPGCLQFTKCGSMMYAAPELIRGDGYCPFRADVWSLGICICALLFARLPFDVAYIRAEAFKQYVAARRKGEPTILDVLAQSRPGCSSALDLLKACLDPDPSTRLSMKQVLEHPWLASSGQSDQSTSTVATASRVRQLGWAVSVTGKQLRSVLIEVLEQSGLEFHEVEQSRFVLGVTQELTCLVSERNGMGCIQWERNEASPFEVKELYHQVRAGLEERLGSMVDIFTQGLPAQEDSYTPSFASPKTRDTQPQAGSIASNASCVHPGSDTVSHEPELKSPQGVLDDVLDNKRKSFEGLSSMPDDSDRARKSGFGALHVNSAPALQRSASRLSLKAQDSELEMLFDFES